MNDHEQNYANEGQSRASEAGADLILGLGGSADEPRANLLDKSLRQYTLDMLITTCGAWSDVRDRDGAINEAKCEFASALEKRLRSAINELADLSLPPNEK